MRSSSHMWVVGTLVLLLLHCVARTSIPLSISSDNFDSYCLIPLISGTIIIEVVKLEIKPPFGGIFTL